MKRATHRAERPHINRRPQIGRLLDQLRRHVRRRPQHRAAAPLSALGPPARGEAKVDQLELRLARVRKDEIIRLDVAVRHPEPVHVRERVANLQREPRRHFLGQAAAGLLLKTGEEA